MTMFFAVLASYIHLLNMKDEELDLSSTRHFFTAAVAMLPEVADNWHAKHTSPYTMAMV